MVISSWSWHRLEQPPWSWRCESSGGLERYIYCSSLTNKLGPKYALALHMPRDPIRASSNAWRRDAGRACASGLTEKASPDFRRELKSWLVAKRCRLLTIINVRLVANLIYRLARLPKRRLRRYRDVAIECKGMSGVDDCRGGCAQ